MDQNQWFNSGSPAPTLDRQAFEAGDRSAEVSAGGEGSPDQYELERLVV